MDDTDTVSARPATILIFTLLLTVRKNNEKLIGSWVMEL